jgi:hypothetical protein
MKPPNPRVDVAKAATVNVEVPANVSMTTQAPDVLSGNPSIFTLTEEEEEEEENSLPPGILETGLSMEAQTTIPLSARPTLGGQGFGNLAPNAPLARGIGVHEALAGHAQLDAAEAAAKGESGSVRNYALDAEAGRFTLKDGSTSPSPPPSETTATPPEPNAIHARADVILHDVSQTAHATVEPRIRTVIGRAVQLNRSVIVVQIAALVALIDDRLASLRNERPNATEAITARDETIAQFESLKRALEALHGATVRLESGQNGETRAENATKSFVDCIRDWWQQDHVEICRATFKASLFMSCIGVCALVGASAPAIAVSGALIGGRPVIDALKSVADSLRRAPGATND